MEKTIKKPKKNTFYANVKKVAKRFYAKFEAMLHRDREPEAQEGGQNGTVTAKRS